LPAPHLVIAREGRLAAALSRIGQSSHRVLITPQCDICLCRLVRHTANGVLCSITLEMKDEDIANMVEAMVNLLFLIDLEAENPQAVRKLVCMSEEPLRP
jgi:hypothetical protein